MTNSRTKSKQLGKLLKDVKGSYDDFVIGLQMDAERRINGIEELTEFLTGNKDADTDEVIEFIESIEFRESRK